MRINLLSCLAALASALTLNAADRYWTNNAGGPFDTALNWSPNLVPGAADSAFFTNNTSYQVSWLADGIVSNFTFRATSGVVTQAGGAFTLQLPGGYVLGPNPGEAPTLHQIGGSLRVTNAAANATVRVERGTNILDQGLLQANRLELTNNAGHFVLTSGTLLTGNANLNNARALVVGGTASVWTNTGSITLGGAGSFGELLITNGATVRNGTLNLGGSVSSNNRLVVVGTNSLLSNVSTISISSSNNSLLVTNGGRLVSDISFDADSRLNSVAVVGTNSSWFSGGSLSLQGERNNLLFASGALATNHGASINGLSNRITVAGPSTVWRAGFLLSVGLVGENFGQVVITNGGTVIATNCHLGGGLPSGEGGASQSDGNSVTVTGSNSAFTVQSDLRVGFGGASNSLLVANGARLTSSTATIGAVVYATNNWITLTGAGSVWTNTGLITIGSIAPGNRLFITDGARLVSGSANIGSGFGTGSLAMVTGENSTWICTSSINVGASGNQNGLLVSAGGLVLARGLTLGNNSDSNLLAVTGGTLIITNATQNALLELRRGTNVLELGQIQADRLLATNPLCRLEFLGGTLNVRTSTVALTPAFFIGNGVLAAELNLEGNGSHSFNPGLTLRSNATLTGNGTVAGLLTIQPGGSLAPGTGIGRINFSNSPAMSGLTELDISKSGSVLTNDVVSVGSTLTYGGALTVTDVGPNPIGLNDTFPLFSASSYHGAFANISLPALGSGLMWTNQLLVNGAIKAVALTQPAINGLTQSGTSLVFNVTGGSPGSAFTVLTSTNVALPVASWSTNSTGDFDWLGNVTLTNGINAATSQRYYSIRVP